MFNLYWLNTGNKNSIVSFVIGLIKKRPGQLSFVFLQQKIVILDIEKNHWNVQENQGEEKTDFTLIALNNVNEQIGIIGGSGLDNPDILKNSKIKTAPQTPFGKPSDDLTVGEIEGIECVLLARHGRKHNVMPGNVNYRANIWTLKEEGCTHIVAATATGSLQEHIKPGDIVILDNFIDR